ncbi:alpha/beta fold hydrolase [Roseomonas sp. OT10]|uniref:alpha/beta fold hydrolase n=1 Tax=Roseomonas cutis TaxID=2897332 RepID=UPI001E62CED0|nr:alpha/beta fold hydrolase [Roseomonas sp. OT10]UFN48440.1 alpha/beta fold hydrolase [Roseomonas sp. OT10]
MPGEEPQAHETSLHFRGLPYVIPAPAPDPGSGARLAMMPSFRDQAAEAASAAEALEQVQMASRRRETPCGAGTMVWHLWGEGPPIVLLHGGAGSWRHWVRNIPALSRSRTVLAADLPGLGESAMPPEPYGPDSLGGIVAAGLTELLPPGAACDLVGFSFGALIAGHVAAAAASSVRSLVLVGAGALGVPRGPIRLERVRDKTGAERRAAHRANLERLMLADPVHVDDLALEIQEWNSSRARVASVPFATSASLSGVLPRVPAPVAAIWGERDAPAAPDLPGRIAALRQARPDASVRIIPGAGHWVAYEAPAAFHATLEAVLPRA